MTKKPFTKKQLARQDKALRSDFKFLNERFFDNRISPSTTVVFATISGEDAHYLSQKQVIAVDNSLRNRWRQLRIVLLHEMAHAALFQNGYIGYLADEGHGDTFRGEIARLIKAGAYDGLL